MVTGGPDNLANTDTSVYYVDQDGGSNSNNGLTTGTAWATPQYADSNIVVGSYPVIVALDPRDTWSSAVAIPVRNGGTASCPVIWDGAYYGWGQAGTAVLQKSGDAAVGHNSIMNIFGDSSDYTFVQNIDFDGDSNNTYGLVIGGRTRGECAPGSWQYGESNITIDNCNFYDFGGTAGDYSIAILIGTWASDMYDITVKNCSIDGVYNHGLAVYNSYPGLGAGAANAKIHRVSFLDNTITNCLMRGDGVGSHIMLSGGVDSSVIDGNIITQGINGTGDAIVITSNDEGGYYPKNIHISRNIVKMDDGRCLVYTNGDSIQSYAYYNHFYTDSVPSVSAVVLIDDSVSGHLGWNAACDFRFYNNTVLTNDGKSLETNIGYDNTLIVRNNLLINNGNSAYGDPALSVETAGELTAHTNNLYHRNTMGADYPLVTIIDEGPSYKDSSTTMGWETNAIVDDPTLTVESADDATLQNWHLQTGSPAIDAGIAITDINITTDLEGVALGSPLNIGIYETIEDP
jgi:hypothetical protein